MATAVSTAQAGTNLSRSQAKFTHPTFDLLQPVWAKLRDVREGTGGFLDGTYLIAHPREWIDHTSDNPSNPTKKLKTRRKLASYENVAARILEAMRSALFREQPTRRVGDEEDVPPPAPPEGEKPKPPLPAVSTFKTRASARRDRRQVRAKKKTEEPQSPLEAWWDNVDGAGTHIDDYMDQAWDVAGTFGHLHIYLDRSPLPEGAQTQADENLPFLRAYTPLDTWDWVVDELGQLQAVKFAELAPRTSIDQPWKPEVQVRVIDRENWTLYDKNGKRVDGGPHNMGCCPVVTLYAERRSLDPVVGKAVLGDPNLYIDLYNLISEVRELLRNQTFGILNVPLGTGEGAMTVTEAQTVMGNAVGTENVLFSGLAAGYVSPSAENVTVYHLEIARKLRTIYRLVGVQWESDSKDAEAEGSLQLKREDLNQRLAAFADECETADYDLAELFFRATLGAEKGASAIEDEQVTIKYPEQFDMTPFQALIEEAQAARDLGMGATFMKVLRKMLVTKFTGMADQPQTIVDAIMQEIDAAPADLTPAEQAMQRLDLTKQALASGKSKGPGNPLPKEPAA